MGNVYSLLAFRHNLSRILSEISKYPVTDARRQATTEASRQYRKASKVTLGGIMLCRNDNDEGVYLQIGMFTDADSAQSVRFLSLEDEQTAIQFKFRDDDQIASISTQLLLLLDTEKRRRLNESRSDETVDRRT